MTNEIYLTLLGGPPWGFRISGGKDQIYPPYISQVLTRSKASQQGLRAGDFVLSLNGTPLRDLSLNDVQKLLKNITGALRVSIKRNQSSAAISLTSPQEVISNDEEPIIRQPRAEQRQEMYLRQRTDSIESDITGLTKKQMTVSKVSRSAMNSQENLLSMTTIGTPQQWTPTQMRKQIRQWAPVKFYPVSSKKPTNEPELVEPLELRAQSQSAPVTPTPTSKQQLSTNVLSTRQTTTTRTLLAPKSELIIERQNYSVSVAHATPVIPPPPVYTIPSNNSKPVLARHTLPRSFTNLAPLHEGLSLSLYVDTKHSPNVGYTVTDFSDNAYSSNNRQLKSHHVDKKSTVVDINKLSPMRNVEKRSVSNGSSGIDQNQHQKKYFTFQDLRESSSKYLPDEEAFRADSTCSDHPSLATTSLLSFLDVDGSSGGSQAADLEETTGFDVGATFETSATTVVGKMFDNLRIPDKQIQESVFFENIKKLSDEDDRRLRNAFNTLMNVNNNAQRGNPADNNISSDNLYYGRHINEPHYPRAFQANNLIVRPSARWTPAKSNGSATSSPMLFGAYRSHNVDSSVTGAKSTTFENYDDEASRLAASKVQDYKPVQLQSYDERKSHSQKENNLSTSNRNSSSLSRVTDNVGTSSEVARDSAPLHRPPPPPPPPPPPSSSLRSSLKQPSTQVPSYSSKVNDTTDKRVGLADSEIEYPEKQSVSNLRDTIQSKLHRYEARKENGTNIATSSIDKTDSYPSSEFFKPTVKVPESYPSSDFLKPIVKAPEAATSESDNLYYSKILTTDIRKKEVVSKTSAYNVSSSFNAQQNGSAAGQSNMSSQSRSLFDKMYAPPVPAPFVPAMGSPTPPPRPPTPQEFRHVSRPDNFARPYDSSSFRDGSRVVTKTNYYAPQKSTTVYKADIYSNPSESLLSVDKKSEYSTQRSSDQQRFSSRNQQHDWYKSIYKKMHTLDLPDDKAVTRYRVQDYLADRYVYKNVDRPDEGSGKKTVGYKFNEYLSEPEAELDTLANYSFSTNYQREMNRAGRENFVRSNRSKSVDRSDTGFDSFQKSTDTDTFGGKRVLLKSDYYKANTTDDLFSKPSTHGKSQAQAATYGSYYNGSNSNVKREDPFGTNYTSSRYGRNTDDHKTQSNFFVNGAQQKKTNENMDMFPFEIQELEKLEKELSQAQANLLKSDSYKRSAAKQSSDIYGKPSSDIYGGRSGQSSKPIVYDAYSSLPSYSPSVPSYTPVSNLASPSGTDFRGVGRALYTFDARAPGELIFYKGDLIKIRRKIDDHWYEGEIRGQAGLVPANYIEITVEARGDERLVMTEVEAKSIGSAVALYNFDGRKFHEVPLRKGEVVSLLRKVDDIWYEGRNEMGRIGIFPANYVHVISEPKSARTDYVETVDPAEPIQRSISSTKTYPSLSSSLPVTTNDYLGSPAVKAAKANIDKTNTFKVLFDYHPRNSDELELKENDTIYVIEKCDDNWYIGTSLRTGKFGTFPGNYVTSA